MLSTESRKNCGNLEISWAWGFAWMLGIYIGSGVSGAHMNPAISITLSFYRRFPWRQCIIYIVIQLFAGIVAGALAYGVFHEMIQHADPTLEASWSGFFGTPKDWMSTKGAVLCQIVQSAIVVVVMLALGDDRNDTPGAGMHAFVSPRVNQHIEVLLTLTNLDPWAFSDKSEANFRA